MSGICQVVFENNTPCDWDVRIIEIGANFFFQDQQGNPAGNWQTTRSANIDCGQQDTLDSNDASKCVVGVYAGVTAYVPGQGNQTFTGASTTDKDHCLLVVPFNLAPQGSTSAAELSAALRARPLGLVQGAERKAQMDALKTAPNKKPSK